MENLGVLISIPNVLQPFVNKQREISLSFALSDTKDLQVKEVLEKLVRDYEGLEKYIFNDSREVNSFVNVYLNDKALRFLPQKLATEVNDGDIISLLLATAGG